MCGFETASLSLTLKVMSYCSRNNHVLFNIMNLNDTKFNCTDCTGDCGLLKEYIHILANKSFDHIYSIVKCQVVIPLQQCITKRFATYFPVSIHNPRYTNRSVKIKRKRTPRVKVLNKFSSAFYDIMIFVMQQTISVAQDIEL